MKFYARWHLASLCVLCAFAFWDKKQQATVNKLWGSSPNVKRQRRSVWFGGGERCSRIDFNEDSSEWANVHTSDNFALKPFAAKWIDTFFLNIVAWMAHTVRHVIRTVTRCDVRVHFIWFYYDLQPIYASNQLR